MKVKKKFSDRSHTWLWNWEFLYCMRGRTQICGRDTLDISTQRISSEKYQNLCKGRLSCCPCNYRHYIHVKSPSLGGRLPLFDLISLLNIHLPPRNGNLPLFEPNFLPIIFSLKRVNCIEFCKVNALLSQQSIHKVKVQ